MGEGVQWLGLDSQPGTNPPLLFIYFSKGEKKLVLNKKLDLGLRTLWAWYQRLGLERGIWTQRLANAPCLHSGKGHRIVLSMAHRQVLMISELCLLGLAVMQKKKLIIFVTKIVSRLFVINIDSILRSVPSLKSFHNARIKLAAMFGCLRRKRSKIASWQHHQA